MGKIPAENTEKLCGKIVTLTNDLCKFAANCQSFANQGLYQFTQLRNSNAEKSGTGVIFPTKGSGAGGEDSAPNKFNASEELGKLKKAWEDIRGKENAKFNDKKVGCLYEFLDIEGRRACGSKRKSSKKGKSAAVVQKVIDLGDKLFDNLTKNKTIDNLTSEIESAAKVLRKKTFRTPGIGRFKLTSLGLLDYKIVINCLDRLVCSFNYLCMFPSAIQTALNSTKTGK